MTEPADRVLSAHLPTPARGWPRRRTWYRALGMVLVMLSWLIVLCAAATFSLTIGAVLADEPPLNRRLRRG
ncbi:hypothetical protein [Streptomyces sp. NPDC003393]